MILLYINRQIFSQLSSAGLKLFDKNGMQLLKRDFNKLFKEKCIYKYTNKEQNYWESISATGSKNVYRL